MTKLTTQQLEILSGLMLGDGHLEKHKNGKNACLRITRQIKDEEYINYHINIFNNFNTKKTYSAVFDKRTNKTYYSCKLRTSVNPIFTDIHSQWYINTKKHVPQQLILTPTVLATWFADDGSITAKNGIYSIKLATHGFLKEEVIFLQNKLKQTFNLNFNILTEKSGKTIQWYLLMYNKENVKNFVNIIKQAFPPLKRKSDIWNNSKYLFEEKNISKL